ncbi:MAG: c-type cytochrome [Hyphomonadaceae bacterium]|nr:c-type cytochrome [Hyphomonadaceae bacterium]
MKKMLLGALIAFASACTPAQQEMTREQLVQRGEYLVTAIGGCNDCHTPMTPTGPDMTQSLHGAELMFAPTIEMPWAPYAPTLAGGPAGYTEEQFVAFLQTGVRPDGSQARPPMPQFRVNEDDARAMVAYINALPPPPAQ